MPHPPKHTVDLGHYEGWALIVSRPTGVFYTSQVGGYACLHPSYEGFFVPLVPDDESIPHARAIDSHFAGA